MPLMGLLGGVGQGLADTGQMMQKDALETRREKRLEEARMRQEERANTEWRDRQDEAFTRTYGAEADPSKGTKNIDIGLEFGSKYGAGADPALGAGHYETEILTDRTRRTEDAKNEANQFSGLLTDPTVGAHQRGPDGRIHSVGSGAGGVGKAGDGNLPPGAPGAEVPAQVFTSLRADYAHRINPGDMALASAAREGDEAFMRYIQETGQIGSLLEFARSEYGIDLRTGTYMSAPAGGASGGGPESQEQPPMEGAQKAPDGNWYVQQDGKWFRVD